MPEILALIPARAGSKGVPRKNVLPVGGKPLLEWTFQAAQAAPSLKRVILSTDDLDAERLAKQAGIEVPFRRPVEFATDGATSVEVAIHALSFLKEHERYEPEWLLLLQPTSPLRTAEDIEAIVKISAEHSCDAVISVCPVDQHPYWIKKIDESGRLLPWLDHVSIPTKRQDLPELYRLNGALYLIRCEVLCKLETFHPPNIRPYIMSAERSIDIDSPLDLKICNLILSTGKTKA